jgi:hypothetical protein
MTKVRGYSWISRTADLSKMQTNRGSAAMSGVRFPRHRGEIYRSRLLQVSDYPPHQGRADISKVWVEQSLAG